MRDSILPYNNSSLISKHAEDIATESTENRRFYDPLSFDALFSGSTTNIRLIFISPETIVYELYFAVDIMMISITIIFRRLRKMHAF